MLNVALFCYHRRRHLSCFHYRICWPFFLRFAPNKIHFTLHLVVIFSVYWLRYDLLYLYLATCIYFIRFLTQPSDRSVSLQFHDYTKYQQFHHYNWFDSDRKWMFTFWPLPNHICQSKQSFAPSFQWSWLYGEKDIDIGIDFNYNGSSSIILIRMAITLNAQHFTIFTNINLDLYIHLLKKLKPTYLYACLFILLSFRASFFSQIKTVE